MQRLPRPYYFCFYSTLLNSRPQFPALGAAPGYFLSTRAAAPPLFSHWALCRFLDLTCHRFAGFLPLLTHHTSHTVLTFFGCTNALFMAQTCLQHIPFLPPTSLPEGPSLTPFLILRVLFVGSPCFKANYTNGMHPWLMISQQPALAPITRWWGLPSALMLLFIALHLLLASSPFTRYSGLPRPRPHLSFPTHYRIIRVLHHLLPLLHSHRIITAACGGSYRSSGCFRSSAYPLALIFMHTRESH